VGLTSDTDGTNVGVRAKADGFLGATRAGSSTQPTAYFNKKTNDGAIVNFYKDGSTVGSIGSYTSLPYIGKSDVTLLFDPSGPHMIPRGTNGGARDAAINLGSSSNRFKDLYLSGSAYVGDKISHDGDSDTYMQFHAANQWRVVTGGTEMLEVNDSNVIIQSPLNMNNNYIDHVEDIYLRDKLFHDGDTDTYLGFRANEIALRAGNIEMTYNADGLFLTSGTLREKHSDIFGTSPTCNVNNSGSFALTMTGNTTFNFTSPTSLYSTGFVLQLTGNGGTVTWPSSVDWAGGTAPDAPASGETDLLVFWTRNGGTTWYGALAIDAAA
jgi:hypothetical protein